MPTDRRGLFSSPREQRESNSAPPTTVMVCSNRPLQSQAIRNFWKNKVSVLCRNWSGTLSQPPNSHIAHSINICLYQCLGKAVREEITPTLFWRMHSNYSDEKHPKQEITKPFLSKLGILKTVIASPNDQKSWHNLAVLYKKHIRSTI